MNTPEGYAEVKIGEKVKRGDIFVDEGQVFEMDKAGRLLGLEVIGMEIKKSGNWFRKVK